MAEETRREKALRKAYEAQIERIFINSLSQDTIAGAVEAFKKGMTKADMLDALLTEWIAKIEERS